jgi:hypothetical protein
MRCIRRTVPPVCDAVLLADAAAAVHAASSAPPPPPTHTHTHTHAHTPHATTHMQGPALCRAKGKRRGGGVPLEPSSGTRPEQSVRVQQGVGLCVCVSRRTARCRHTAPVQAPDAHRGTAPSRFSRVGMSTRATSAASRRCTTQSGMGGRCVWQKGWCAVACGGSQAPTPVRMP